MKWHYRFRIYSPSGELIETVNFYRDELWDYEQMDGFLFMRCGYHHSGILEVHQQGWPREFPHLMAITWKGAHR